MLTYIEKQHYARHISLPEIGETGQEKLKNASVLVVGAGGLGCAVLTALVTAGLGKIGIIDADVVSLSNLQRQPLYGIDSLGLPKVDVAKQRLSLLNPQVELSTFPVFLDSDNADELMTRYDIIVDACDNLETRYLLNDACLRAKKPWVHGALAGFVGQVSVFNYRDCGTYRCLYPNERGHMMENKAPAGVLSVLPTVIGTFQANEVIKLVCEMGSVLAGRLLIYDMRTMSQRMLRYRKMT